MLVDALNGRTLMCVSLQYRAEGVDVATIEFINNQPCVDLIEKGAIM